MRSRALIRGFEAIAITIVAVVVAAVITAAVAAAVAAENCRCEYLTSRCLLVGEVHSITERPRKNQVPIRQCNYINIIV